MGKKDRRVDAYIAKSPEFAKPILTHLRKLIHAACPEVEETTKWSMPFFDYQGAMCGMAAFKQHCAFILWKASLILAKDNGADKAREEAMGHLGRIRSLSDLPEDKVLIGYIKEAARLNEEGINPTRSKPGLKKHLVIPDDLAAALKKDTKARKTFEGFSYTHKKEYVQWITEAKRDETRKKRLGTTLEWLARGKPRHWKYTKC